MLLKSFAFLCLFLLSISNPGAAFGATISGTLAFEGSPTPESFVNIWDEWGNHVTTAWPDGGGNWESDHLPDGTYYLTARGEDFGRVSELYENQPCPWEACDVTLGDAVILSGSDETGIAFDLAPGSWRLRGSLRDGVGQPIAGAVRLYHEQGWPIFEMWPDEGNFESELLPDGSYFAVTVFTEGMLDEAWEDVPCANRMCDLTQASDPIIVSGGDVDGLHFVLEPITSGGHISGQVSGPGGPLANVGIDLFNANGEHLGGSGTDSEGRYETGLLADGTFFVVAQSEHLGLGSELWDNIPCPSWECGHPPFVTGGTAISITGSDRPDIDFELDLPDGSMISGQLIDDQTGFPVPGVGMVLIDADTGHFIQWGGSNGNGDYYFMHLEAGNYKVLAEGVPEGYTPELYGGDYWPCDLVSCGATIAIPDDSTVASGMDIYLDFEGTRIVGRITRSDTGEPVNGGLGWVGVELFNASGDQLDFSHANEAGLYEFHLEGSGAYYLAAVNDAGQHHLINEVWDDIPCYEHCFPPEVAGASTIPLAEGETFVANFELDPGYRIFGTLAFDGAPTHDSWVNIWNGAGNHIGQAGNLGDGNWESPILPPGTYYATAHGEEFGHVSELYDGIACPWEACDVTQGAPIVLASTDAHGIAFDLEPEQRLWRLRGSMRNGEGHPVGGAVRLYNVLGWPMYEMWTDHEGNFESDLLADGSYFAATVFTDGLLDEAWDDVPCVNQVCELTQVGTPIVVSGADVGSLDFVLQPIHSGGHIIGQVRGPDGPLAFTNVEVRNANGDHLFGLPTDADGNYRTQLLADDTYFVVAQNERLGLGREIWDDIPCTEEWHCWDPAFIRDHGTPVAISGADRPGIDFDLVLPPGGMVSGQLVDADTGLPVPGSWMTLIDAESGEFIRGIGADWNGEYYFSGLAPGNYKILAEWLPEGYTPELYGGDHWHCDLVVCGTAVNIPDDTTALSGLDIYLDFEGTRIVGRITRSDTGEAVSGAQGWVGVDLFNASGHHMGGAGANEAGLYDIRLDAGEYYLMATNDTRRHYLINEVWEDIECIDDCHPLAVTGASLITVNEGETFVAHFELTARTPPFIERRAEIHPTVGIEGDSVIEENVVIHEFAYLEFGVHVIKNVEIGAHCWIRYNVQIGQNTVLGPGCFVGENTFIDKGVVTGEGVFIGPNSSIGKDVQIGEYSSIGANVDLGKSVIVWPHVCIPDGTAIPKDGVVDANLCH